MKRFILVLLILLFSLNFNDGVIAETDHRAEDFASYERPDFHEASVHDPSIEVVDGRWYVIGSHLASAYTDNGYAWYNLSTRVEEGNPLIPEPFQELDEALTWASTLTLWASDWIYLPETGQYYLYYCACEGSSPRSALGYAVADDIEGPYKHQKILLKSGNWGEEGPDGKIYDPVFAPNAIDPHVFFDQEGNLWMVYGSYSGGIFILEMDEKTGEIVPGQGWGTKLMGGGHTPIEGPYILYHPESEYYYLFTSYGGLDTQGGYNIRVGRSEDPAGPYFDSEGRNLYYARGTNQQFSRIGAKLIGNHSWSGPTGVPVLDRGYLSPGHNSALYDEDLEEAFLIFHARFQGGGEGHRIRTHHLLLNDEGWPVVSPFRYGGETDSIEDIFATDFYALNDANGKAFNFHILDMQKDTSAEIHTSEPIVFYEDGHWETENNSGAWSLNNGYFHMKDDLGDASGRALRQWNPLLGQVSPVATVMHEDGSCSFIAPVPAE